MPWRECNRMDERLRFVARLLEGEKMAVVCREFGISRKTGYKLFNRYQDEGLSGLEDRPRSPYRHPNKLPFQIETAIVRIKREHRSWGALLKSTALCAPINPKSSMAKRKGGKSRTFTHLYSCVVAPSRATGESRRIELHDGPFTVHCHGHDRGSIFHIYRRKQPVHAVRDSTCRDNHTMSIVIRAGSACSVWHVFAP